MSLAPGWHPVALSGSIDPGTSAGTHLDGREYVVWRDNSGVAHVWEDRCPHRGMKLSFGFVRGDHIACLYHGWQYDTAGRCRYIPAHPDLDVPATITVPVFATVETCGMIWTTTDAAPNRAAPPADPGEAMAVTTLYADIGPLAFLDAVRALPPQPFIPGDPEPQLSQIDGALWRLTAGGDVLLLGMQRLNDVRSALHVVIAGSASTYAGAGQSHVFAWTRALRHRLATVPAKSEATHAEAV
ncbi:Rieske (2Fe-2S) protein [Aquibium carbonis]|uniref:Rieske (2Fe-2S) protein n=1 Tax=Aquibium carbonis TaxID=2495581 RepID=A0A3S0A814_9HYPH|nr:Rieske (2Fe-2S) protein [Aquibium carbonis]RST86766.1 Rieske (2Fe-2S) protein [Aquibium carbonis]